MVFVPVVPLDCAAVVSGLALVDGVDCVAVSVVFTVIGSADCPAPDGDFEVPFSSCCDVVFIVSLFSVWLAPLAIISASSFCP